MNKNPFDFDGAKNLPPNLLLKWFIDDFNYARFLKSTRNVLLKGHRGCGKSMTLLYYSLPLEIKKAEATSPTDLFDNIGIYISCSTPLSRRVDHDYFENNKFSQAISEHYLVLAIAVAIAEHCEHLVPHLQNEDFETLRSELYFVFDDEIPQDKSIFKTLKKILNKELRTTQEKFFLFEEQSEFSFARTFYTLILPFLSALRSVPLLEGTHFSLMIDDAQDLNEDQRLLLNSWLSYRDHSVFSFKVALATLEDFDRRTATGGSIIEGHDFIAIDLEQPFQNENSKFGQLARSIIERRLLNVGITAAPDSFFKESTEFRKGLDECELQTRQEYLKSNPEASQKQIADHIYKQARALYFRSRSPKANRPIYSGLDTLIHLSSGVIRNLLLPCYWMYDDVLSSQGDDDVIDEIPPAVQSEVIIRESEKLWTRIRDGLDKEMDDCSREQASQISSLIEALGDYFRDRLHNHASEPRIVTFTISQIKSEPDPKLMALLAIMRKAQILYRRLGSAKDEGRQEYYYTLNRLFWPARGLDPHGQHGRASIKESDLCYALENGKLPKLNTTTVQRGLFDE